MKQVKEFIETMKRILFLPAIYTVVLKHYKKTNKQSG